MEPDAIRSRLRVVRSVFLWVVIAAVGVAALVFGFTIVSYVLFAAVVVLIVFRIAREASIRRTLERADKSRIDQASPGNAAGFTSIGVGGLIVQILVVLVIDALLVQNVLAHHFDRHAPFLLAIAIILTIFVIVVAALTFRLRSLQRKGIANLEAHA